MAEKAVVGQAVRVRCEIIQPACGDHPDLLIASPGETGVVVEVDETKTYPLGVLMDRARKDTIYLKHEEVQTA